MKCTGFWAISMGALAGAGLLAAASANAGQNEDRCSLATLKGLYMFAQSRYQSVNGTLVPLGVTGEGIFYGNGKFDSLATISLGGTIFTAPAPGTYVINPNSDNPPSRCTGSVTVKMQPNAPDVHLDIYIQPDGDQFFTLETDPGTVLSGTEERVAR